MSMINWEDVVFEYRNKDYGAYRLRKNYPYCLTISALIVIILFLSSMVGPQLFKEKQLQEPSKKLTVIKYSELAPPPSIEKIHLPPKTVVVVQKKIQKYVAPKVVIEEIKEEEEMPTVEEVSKNMDTASTGVQGAEEGNVEVIAPPQEVEEEIEVTPPEPDLTVKPPEFPGGDKALAKWLENHLKYPAVATRMGIQGVVTVEFTVDVKGKISDVKVVQSLHRLCDNEAMRLVSSMPAWIPGESNDGKVTAKCKLPIPFHLG
jgi:periplasmic protein TonB